MVPRNLNFLLSYLVLKWFLSFLLLLLCVKVFRRMFLQSSYDDKWWDMTVFLWSACVCWGCCQIIITHCWTAVWPSFDFLIVCAVLYSRWAGLHMKVCLVCSRVSGALECLVKHMICDLLQKALLYHTTAPSFAAGIHKVFISWNPLSIIISYNIYLQNVIIMFIKKFKSPWDFKFQLNFSAKND